MQAGQPMRSRVSRRIVRSSFGRQRAPVYAICDNASSRARFIDMTYTVSRGGHSQRYFIFLIVVRFFARRAKKRTTGRKYHAAVHPEPARPERVEGSKGRLKSV